MLKDLGQVHVSISCLYSQAMHGLWASYFKTVQHVLSLEDSFQFQLVFAFLICALTAVMAVQVPGQDPGRALRSRVITAAAAAWRSHLRAQGVFGSDLVGLGWPLVP